MTHGNGPQVGLLALMGDACGETAPYPLDVLDAETEGQIGYVLEMQLDNFIDHQDTVAVITRTAMEKTDNGRAKFMHCLPAFHDNKTVVGSEVMEHTRLKGGLEVTDEVFESARSIVFDQTENRLHTIKAVLAATIGAA